MLLFIQQKLLESRRRLCPTIMLVRSFILSHLNVNENYCRTSGARLSHVRLNSPLPLSINYSRMVFKSEFANVFMFKREIVYNNNKNRRMWSISPVCKFNPHEHLSKRHHSADKSRRKTVRRLV